MFMCVCDVTGVGEFGFSIVCSFGEVTTAGFCKYNVMLVCLRLNLIDSCYDYDENYLMMRW